MMKPFGEIIESTLSGFKAQCWQWDVLPSFGSLVVVQSYNFTLYGIVTSVQTGAIDKGRFPFPYQKTEEELRREQPQIFALLQSHVCFVTVGYTEGTTRHYQLPPFPAKIHSFVRQATQDEMKLFFEDCAYLHILCGAADIEASLQELLLALLKHLFDYNVLSYTQLQQFISTYSALMSNDYRKFKFFLQRIEALIASMAIKRPDLLKENII
jgi:hypothetical protein